MDHTVEPSTNGHSGHEHREANLGVIVWSGLGLAVATLLIMGFVILLFNVMRSAEDKIRPSISRSSPPATLPPEPRLPPCTQLAVGNCIVEPALEFEQLRAHEDQVLKTYGWQDQKNGIVHIPIDKAMDAVLQKGINGGRITSPAPPKGAGK